MRSVHAPAAALLLLAACVGSAPEGPGTSPSGTVSENGLSLNKLSLNKLSLNKLSLNKLSLNSLSADGLAGLDQTADGREVLKYVARCALPDDQSLTTTVDGVDYTFPGLLGTAPQWTQAPCDRTCQRWVSACLLAHVNATGVSVPISLRGPHPALTATVEEIAEYDVQEAAFYGNLFDPDFGVDYPMFSCGGTDLDQLFDSTSDLWRRLCGVLHVDECPITDAGSCLESIDDRPPACDTQLADGTYSGCWRAESVGLLVGQPDPTDLPDPADAVFEEVITVYLRN